MSPQGVRRLQVVLISRHDRQDLHFLRSQRNELVNVVLVAPIGIAEPHANRLVFQAHKQGPASQRIVPLVGECLSSGRSNSYGMPMPRGEGLCSRKARIRVNSMSSAFLNK